MGLYLPATVDRLPRHKRRLLAACEAGRAEADVVGMAIAGSFVDGTPDEYSDLDLRVVVRDGTLERVFARREEIASNSGPLIAAFTGEHVGEPQLLITLYEDLVHVDFLFVALAEAAERNLRRRVQVLWERTPEVSVALSHPYVANPVEDLNYLEARIWTWTWYIQSKILRGELWEAVSALNFVRDAALFRLLALEHGVRFRGARHMQELLREHAATFAQTQTAVEQSALLEALRATVRLYLEVADPMLARNGVRPNIEARKIVMRALDSALSWRPDDTERG